MQQLNVITPLEEPTEWCAPIIVVPKDSGDIRICVDLTELNRYVRRERHPIPADKHSLAQLSEAKVFSKIDANSGFWQIPLSKESRLLTTFITPFGRYCFNRLPFGIASAPEHFQRRMAAVMEGLAGVICHMGDVLVFGRNPEEHDHGLLVVLHRLEKTGITLNPDKCVFRKSRIDFLGHEIDERGISLTSKLLKAVQDILPPNIES